MPQLLHPGRVVSRRAYSRSGVGHAGRRGKRLDIGRRGGRCSHGEERLGGTVEAIAEKVIDTVAGVPRPKRMGSAQSFGCEQDLVSDVRVLFQMLWESGEQCPQGTFGC